MQQFALYLSFVLVAGVAASFLFVVARSSAKGDAGLVQSAVNSLRTKVIWLMIGVGAPVGLALAYEWPHSPGNFQGDPIIVTAESGQWYWNLSHFELPIGAPIVFKLTTIDVNHGFGLYDEDFNLVTQAQAMPGYTNKLNHVFTKPGTYTVACLEYCGVAHHAMLAEINVVDPVTYAATVSEQYRGH